MFAGVEEDLNHQDEEQDGDSNVDPHHSARSSELLRLFACLVKATHRCVHIGVQIPVQDFLWKPAEP